MSSSRNSAYFYYGSLRENSVCLINMKFVLQTWNMSRNRYKYKVNILSIHWHSVKEVHKNIFFYHLRLHILNLVNDRGSIWNRKTNTFFNGYGSPIKMQFLMLKLKKKRRWEETVGIQLTIVFGDLRLTLLFWAKPGTSLLGLCTKARKKVDMYKPQRWLLG